MMLFLIIVAIIIIGIIVSKNKEEERQRLKRNSDASELRTKYSDGLSEWQRRKNPYPYLTGYYSNQTFYNNDEILAHKDEIKRLDKEIKDKYKERARIDEEFEREQTNYSDKCYNISKESLTGFGRYHYDFEWNKSKPNGGWSKEKLKVWQFFADGVCFADLDYTYRDCEKKNADVFPEFKDMTRHWNQSVYDKINEFISRISSLSTRPLIVVLVDYKYEWDGEAIDYHFQKIDKNVNNTVFVSLSQLGSAPVNDNQQIEHVIVIDVYSENSQLRRNCEDIEKVFTRPHAAITYITFLKCYEKEEMEHVLRQEKEECERRELHSRAESIISLYPHGYERWAFSFELNGNKDNITDQMVVDAEEAIAEQQEQFEREGVAIIEGVKETVLSWNRLPSGFAYKYLLRYYPTKCDFQATDEEWADRYRVWDFKNDEGKVSEESHKEAVEWVTENVVSTLIREFGSEALKHLTLVCIPASTKMATERRYLDFSKQLCEKTGMANAYTHISVTKDSTPKNKGGEGKPEIGFDGTFFSNKNVILFDDVITKGNSMIQMKAKLEELGATVIAGISIGKTVHHRP